jgi:site-specific recombinase XerD
MIAAWLDSKTRRSGSQNTLRAYRETIASFCAALAPLGLGLGSDPQAVALAAQGWAGQGAPAPSTFNRRLAVLSSFYTFALKRSLLTVNPIGLVERAKVELYADARALDPATIKRQLAAIDRTDLAGQRDYALLAVYLQTGRRLAEVSSLLLRDVQLSGSTVTLHFRRTKGGKVMSDALPVPVSKALLRWLHAFYGPDLARQRPSAPIWVSLARNGHGNALTTRGVAFICQERLGITSVHALRHTFAHAMEQAGAKVSDIQARLGHSSLATTGRYLAALKRAENDQADAIAALFGLDQPPSPPPERGG